MRHFIQRGSDQAAQADHVGLFRWRVEDFFARHHDAEVNDLVVVAGQHDADDVFADVMHIAFDGGEDDFALGLPTSPRAAIAAFSASMKGWR